MGQHNHLGKFLEVLQILYPRQPGQMSLHPGGIPHGPTPGAAEASIGKKETGELAVMIDTFKPLRVTKAALDLEIKDYHLHWL